MRSLAARMPKISATERAALDAGTVWLDGELFSGRPDWRRALAEPYPELASRERAFLAGPVEEVCRMVDPWRVRRERRLPPEVWEHLRREGFFGLRIPREWGGLGFSQLAASAVFAKLVSRSMYLSSLVLIPNSVGPAELLLDYGTPEQRSHYLPRLARGEEIPCFALTEPEAGSDAASITAEGHVFRSGDGELRLRLDFEKRYITLAPVATLIGLAFRLRDPENLLGRGPEPGISCALVPASARGVEIGRHHDPMGLPFPNGPLAGKDVIVPLDALLGGPQQAGNGWRMLMEALAGGRAVSLPAQAAGALCWTARVAGAYSVVRRQFGLPIGRFEGVEEPLARLAGWAYLGEAARVWTCGALDRGERPAVVSALMKSNLTELARRAVSDGMDVLAGAGISHGPHNLLADGHVGTPIGVTVEGANILTRTLITFGQGALRCHPYLQRELAALAAGDGVALARALAGHAVFFARNLARLALLAASRGRLARSPASGPTARFWRRLSWASARFAVLTDLALLAHGARLKRRGKLAGRFADALGWMFLTLAALRRFEAEGRRPEDLPLVRWAAEHGLARVDEATLGIVSNFDTPIAGRLLRLLLPFLRALPLGREPSDQLGGAAAACLASPGEARDRLCGDLYLGGAGIRRLEAALLAVASGAPDAEALRRLALEVDSFSPAEYHGESAVQSPVPCVAATP